MRLGGFVLLALGIGLSGKVISRSRVPEEKTREQLLEAYQLSAKKLGTELSKKIEGRNDYYTEHIAPLEEEIAQLYREYSTLKTVDHELRESLLNLPEGIAMSRGQEKSLQRIQNEINEKKTNIASRQDRYEKNSEQLKKLDSEIFKFEGQIKDLKMRAARINIVKPEYSSLRLQHLSDTLEHLKESHPNVYERISGLEAELSERERVKLEKKEALYSSQPYKYEPQQEELDHLRKSLSKLEARPPSTIANVEFERKRLIKEYKEHIAVLEAQNTSEAQLRFLEQRLKSLPRDGGVNQDLAAALESRINRLKNPDALSIEKEIEFLRAWDDSRLHLVEQMKKVPFLKDATKDNEKAVKKVLSKLFKASKRKLELEKKLIQQQGGQPLIKNQKISNIERKLQLLEAERISLGVEKISETDWNLAVEERKKKPAVFPAWSDARGQGTSWRAFHEAERALKNVSDALANAKLELFSLGVLQDAGMRYLGHEYLAHPGFEESRREEQRLKQRIARLEARALRAEMLYLQAEEDFRRTHSLSWDQKQTIARRAGRQAIREDRESGSLIEFFKRHCGEVFGE